MAGLFVPTWKLSQERAKGCLSPRPQRTTGQHFPSTCLGRAVVDTSTQRLAGKGKSQAGPSWALWAHTQVPAVHAHAHRPLLCTRVHTQTLTDASVHSVHPCTLSPRLTLTHACTRWEHKARSESLVWCSGKGGGALRGPGHCLGGCCPGGRRRGNRSAQGSVQAGAGDVWAGGQAGG